MALVDRRHRHQRQHHLSRRMSCSSSNAMMPVIPPVNVTLGVIGVESMTGRYSDPFHPGCYRDVDASKGEIRGVDGNPGCTAPNVKLKEWSLKASIGDSPGNSDGSVSVKVDFSPKGGPKDLEGKFKDNVISWPDGNAWTKMQL